MIAGVACIAALILPEGRRAGSLIWWWSGDAASILGGAVAIIAVPLLVRASFDRTGRRMAVSGAALTMLAAAIWALSAPRGAVMLVVMAMMLIGPAAELAGPGAWRRAPWMPWWTLGMAAAALSIGAMTLLLTSFSGGTVLTSLGLICAALAPLAIVVIALHADTGDRRALQRRRTLGATAVILATLTGLVHCLALLGGATRSDAMLSARVVMLLITSTAALAALLAAVPAPRTAMPRSTGDT
ncbi:MAG: hypothetical protein KF724_12710 [Phycisphaeraceae bacterium]|nr:hypothetical protein [Phycisphaeraceae bacterium]